MKTRLILTMATACIVIPGSLASAAATFESNGTGGGDWNSASSWTCVDGTCDHDYPVAGDTATVLQDDLIYVDNSEAAANLTVNKKTDGTAGGILDMRASGVLEVSDSLNIQTDATDPGEFHFSATSGTKPNLRASGSLDISGPITVTGSVGGEITRTSNNSVAINSNGIITNEEGPLTISSPLRNDGIIRANASSTSHPITITGAIDGDSTGRFETADHANARMTLAVGSGVTWTTSVTGPYFDVRKGAMTFNDTFGDEAALRMLDGSLTVAAAKSFTANEAWVNP